MTEERRVNRDGIHIDRQVAEGVAIEEELDSNVVGPYRFPDPTRRRVPALIYLALAVLAALIIDPLPALLPLALAVWHWMAAWPLRVEQEKALTKGASAIDFAVGHASAAVTFHGLRSRPHWSVILYSAAEPPDQRALVAIDGVTGEVLDEPYVEGL
ncbi:MAG TPA: hypothetical protein VHL52_10715 [Acidimicrobiia bacterium]|nr:hypothetical protein [Acidimicrobiia bacterium]